MNIKEILTKTFFFSFLSRSFIQHSPISRKSIKHKIPKKNKIENVNSFFLNKLSFIFRDSYLINTMQNKQVKFLTSARLESIKSIQSTLVNPNLNISKKSSDY